jgi:hypothetical protein
MRTILPRTGAAIPQPELAKPYRFALLAGFMLATPLILFAVGCSKNSVMLIDGSGALFGIDTVLLLWLRDVAMTSHPNQG